MFNSADAAIIGAADVMFKTLEIRRSRGEKENELGLVLTPKNGGVALGRLIQGDERSVNPFEGPAPFSIRMPTLHSHPSSTNIVPLHFSDKDMRTLFNTRALKGSYLTAMLDHNSGLLVRIAIKSNVPRPAFIEKYANGDENSIVLTKRWFEEQLKKGNISIVVLKQYSPEKQVESKNDYEDQRSSRFFLAIRMCMTKPIKRACSRTKF